MRLRLTSADARPSSDPPVRGEFGGWPFQRLKESSIFKRMIIVGGCGGLVVGLVIVVVVVAVVGVDVVVVVVVAGLCCYS